MTEKKAKKPKFKKREVAFYTTRGVYVRVEDTPDSEGHLYISGCSDESWCHISELRKQTKREKGD